jgi:hypothetical protein
VAAAPPHCLCADGLGHRPLLAVPGRLCGAVSAGRHVFLADGLAAIEAPRAGDRRQGTGGAGRRLMCVHHAARSHLALGLSGVRPAGNLANNFTWMEDLSPAWKLLILGFVVGYRCGTTAASAGHMADLTSLAVAWADERHESCRAGAAAVVNLGKVGLTAERRTSVIVANDVGAIDFATICRDG